MRNVRRAGMWAALVLSGAGVMTSAGGGCAPATGDATGDGGGGTAAGADVKPRPPLKPKELRQALDAAYAAFQDKRYGQALAAADGVLASNPQGAGAAEAHYVRGRVLEQRSIEAGAAKDRVAAKASQQLARDANNAALTQTPAPPLEGNIRAGIANVAYYQDDYATAITQGTAAYPKIAEPRDKARVLYRVGLSQQRLGDFPAADRTFAAVRQAFPDTDPARQAAAHQGARGFHVQLGTHASPARADAAVAALRSQGVIGLSLPDAAGRHVVRVGPVRTFEQAKALKARLAERHPGALIIP